MKVEYMGWWDWRVFRHFTNDFTNEKFTGIKEKPRLIILFKKIDHRRPFPWSHRTYKANLLHAFFFNNPSQISKASLICLS